MMAASRPFSGNLSVNEPMARHVSWRTGGFAARAYSPLDLNDLANFLASLPKNEPLTFVGLGSNLLVRDGGYKGTVIFTHGALKALRSEEEYIYAEAGVASPKIARFAANQGLGGAEFLAGIPGTMGGALAMNAGCYGSETWDIIARVRTIDRAGVLHERLPSEYDIAYRHVRLHAQQEEYFMGAWLSLAHRDSDAARANIRNLLERRIAAQPLQLPNAGSVFRNPPGDHAARLIEAAGLKGMQMGGAQVSEKHANFIVNPAGIASATDIEKLIDLVQLTVQTKFGIELMREIRIIGEPL